MRGQTCRPIDRRDIENIDCADVLSIYLTGLGEPGEQQEIEPRIERLNEYWGGKMLAQVSAQTCEAAALLWHCWKYREKQTIHSGASKGGPVATNRGPPRHIARFILIGLYTSRRAGAITSASPYAITGRSYVDLERGIFYRKAIGKRTTKKRQNASPNTAAASRPPSTLVET